MKISKKEAWNFLAPYPEPCEGEDALVKKVELFAKVLLIAKETLSFMFKWPYSSVLKFVAQRSWQQRASAVPIDELVQPRQQGVSIASSTQAMDQNFFYVLQQGRIWYKPIAASKQSLWKLFGPDGRPVGGQKLIAISSDGVNLIGIDDSRLIHYVHTDKINFVLQGHDWPIKNIDLDWSSRWFTMPFISIILGLTRRNELKIPAECHVAAISQKGPETGYYTDLNGKKHPEFLVGVTTLYTLSTDGRIYFADPWLSNGFRNEITAPEDGQFVAENMAVAASTIFLLRRETGRLLMYTRFADFDSIGSNPLLPATYNSDNHIPLVRRLPAEDWLKQPEIILKDKATLTAKISILQTGRGQNNRQLRVAGTDGKGKPGFYFKGIYEEYWRFEIDEELSLAENKLSQLRAPPLPFIDFKEETWTVSENTSIKTIQLKKFLRHGLNERGLHTAVELTLNNGYQLVLPLYAYRGWQHLFGLKNNSPYWRLILPKEYQEQENSAVKAAVYALFKNNTSIPVQVDDLENGGIKLSNIRNGFIVKFKPILPPNPMKPLLKNARSAVNDQRQPTMASPMIQKKKSAPVVFSPRLSQNKVS